MAPNGSLQPGTVVVARLPTTFPSTGAPSAHEVLGVIVALDPLSCTILPLRRDCDRHHPGECLPLEPDDELGLRRSARVCMDPLRVPRENLLEVRGSTEHLRRWCELAWPLVFGAAAD